MSTLGAFPIVQSHAAPAVATRTRIEAIDAFRGFVMFLMLAEVMRLWTLQDAFPDEPLLGARRLQHHARAVAGLLAARSHPAGLLVPRRRGAAVLDCQPARLRADASDACSGTPSWRSVVADPARHLPALDGAVARPTGRSKTRSRRSASATRSCSCWRSPRCACRSPSFVGDPRRLLGGVRAVSAARARLRLHAGRRARRLAASLRGLPRALQQELEPLVGLRHLVPEPLPARGAVPLQRAAAGRR